MKRILLLALLLAGSFVLCAQRQVTTFCGIPVDGSKKAMMEIFKVADFGYDRAGDYFTSEFNGEDVTISIATHNSRVWRVAVIDRLLRNEQQIIRRYNELIDQFDANERYAPAAENLCIPGKTSLDYEMLVRKNCYEAVYYQLYASLDDALQAPEGERPKGATQRKVWFTILRDGTKYKIGMYYDNLYNKANGSDL